MQTRLQRVVEVVEAEQIICTSQPDFSGHLVSLQYFWSFPFSIAVGYALPSCSQHFLVVVMSTSYDIATSHADYPHGVLVCTASSLRVRGRTNAVPSLPCVRPFFGASRAAEMRGGRRAASAPRGLAGLCICGSLVLTLAPLSTLTPMSRRGERIRFRLVSRSGRP